ncbi:MAG: FixH family protein [Parvibaculaceae bacterium]|nr:FixH family protein [Parvibaculaceae bacterium]
MKPTTPSRRGAPINEVLADMEAQKARGWTSLITAQAVPMPAGALTRVVLVMRDKSGTSVTGLKVHATMFRPVSAGSDADAEMTEGPAGSYTADFHLPYEGNWVARVAALGKDGAKYAAEERVFVGAR